MKEGGGTLNKDGKCASCGDKVYRDPRLEGHRFKYWCSCGYNVTMSMMIPGVEVKRQENPDIVVKGGTQVTRQPGGKTSFTTYGRRTE